EQVRGNQAVSSNIRTTHAVLLDVLVEVGFVGLEVRRAVAVGEVEEESRLRRLDAREQGGLARVADRARRQSWVLARVEGHVELELRVRWLGCEAPQVIEQRGVDAERGV